MQIYLNNARKNYCSKRFALCIASYLQPIWHFFKEHLRNCFA